MTLALLFLCCCWIAYLLRMVRKLTSQVHNLTRQAVVARNIVRQHFGNHPFGSELPRAAHEVMECVCAELARVKREGCPPRPPLYAGNGDNLDNERIAAPIGSCARICLDCLNDPCICRHVTALPPEPQFLCTRKSTCECKDRKPMDAPVPADGPAYIEVTPEQLRTMSSELAAIAREDRKPL